MFEFPEELVNKVVAEAIGRAEQKHFRLTEGEISESVRPTTLGFLEAIAEMVDTHQSAIARLPNERLREMRRETLSLSLAQHLQALDCSEESKTEIIRTAMA